MLHQCEASTSYISAFRLFSGDGMDKMESV
jgi:hypothetical protein